MRTVLISTITLLLGVLIGIAARRHLDRPAEAQTIASLSPAAPPAPPSLSLPPAPPFSQHDFKNWDPFSDLRAMQKDMDRMFNDSIARFRSQDLFKGIPDAPGYSLSLDVRDLTDRFEVHAALPDAKASDISVKLTDDHTLEVNVSNKTSKDDQGSSSTSWGQYAQTIRLPAPVQVDKMKVERHAHDLRIILPKASA